MRHDKQDVSLTIRLSTDLDHAMRESAGFFGRSVGAEWRTAAALYRRVIILWVEDPGHEDPLLHSLCEGLVSAPPTVDVLRKGSV